MSDFQDNDCAICKVLLRRDLKRAVGGTEDGKVIVWDIPTQAALITCKVGTKSQISGLAWMTNDKLVVSSKLGCLSIIDVSSVAVSSAALGFSAVVAYSQIDTEINCLVLLDETLKKCVMWPKVACACNDGSIRIYALMNKIEEHFRFSRAHESPVTALALLSFPAESHEVDQGNVVVSGAANGTISVWRVVYSE